MQKNKGNDAYKKKEFESAIEFYSKAIELNPEESIYLTNKAAVLIEMKRYDECLEICDKAIELNQGLLYDFKKMGKALARKASCLCAMGRLEDSKETY